MKRLKTLCPNLLAPLLVTSLAVLLAACGTSPPVRYYSLEAAAAESGAQEPGATVVGLGPLRVPEYLRRSQMVTRSEGAQIEVHDYARWAEPVDKAMHRVVAANVDNRLDNVVVIGYPYIESVPVDYVVLGQVGRFDADSSGQVLLQVQWAVLDKDRQGVIPPQRAHYEARAANPSDPDAIARAMNEALNRFSEDIAEQLRGVLD